MQMYVRKYINLFVFLCMHVREHQHSSVITFHLSICIALSGKLVWVYVQKTAHAFTKIHLTDFLANLFMVYRLLHTHSKVFVQMARCIIMTGKCEQLLFIAEQMLTAQKWYIANGMVDCLFSLITEETSAGQGIYAGETWYKITLPEIRD